MLKFIPLLTGAVLALPVPVLAQDTGAVLRIIEAEDQIVRIQAKTRHTTVIVLPASEDILDFVVGDSEYWHLTGAANLAFLKPIAEGVTTNVALVCASGRIYSFLVTEESAGEPHLIVRVEYPTIEDPRISPGVNTPAFVRRSQVTAYQEMAETAMKTVATVQEEAEVRVAEAQAQAEGETEAFRSDYPTRLNFPYRLEDKAIKWPFLVEGMWHDGQFTYLRSNAQETPALYEEKDGKPALVAYDLEEDGLYIARHVLATAGCRSAKKKPSGDSPRRRWHRDGMEAPVPQASGQLARWHCHSMGRGAYYGSHPDLCCAVAGKRRHGASGERLHRGRSHRPVPELRRADGRAGRSRGATGRDAPGGGGSDPTGRAAPGGAGVRNGRDRRRADDDGRGVATGRAEP